MQEMHPESASYDNHALAAVKQLDERGKAALSALPPLISTDSHVMEPDSLWEQLPPRLWENFRDSLVNVRFKRETLPPGAFEPNARLIDQKRDGIQAEIIFPNDGMAVFGLDDPETQQVAFSLYNDFIADFCRAAPKNFFGVPCVAVHDIDAAVKEMHRGLDMGLVGVMVWQVPDPRLPFSSDHYDPLWHAAAEAGAPVHLHILTGHSYARRQAKLVGIEKIRGAVNLKQHDTINGLFDILFTGVFERFPKLKLVLAESECGWLPFVLQQWDYYFQRFRDTAQMPISRKPSEIFEEHVYCTWLEDFSGTRQFTWWGTDNLMWSHDYPHPNMTFPHSRENVVHHIGDLPRDTQMKLVRDNAIRLYGFKL